MANKKIKILYILTNLQLCNGVTSYVMNYLKYMDSNKFSIDFLVCDDSRIDSKEYEEILKKYNSKIFYIKQIGIKNFIKVKNEIKSFFKENAKEYDVVHCHMLNNGAFFLHYAKKYNVKYRILHSHVTKSADTTLKKIRNDLLVPIAIRNATHYFACSNDAGKFIFKNKKFTVINNAIDINRFKYNEDMRNKLRSEMNIKNDTFVFGNVGRLCPQKNQLFLIDVFCNIRRSKNNVKLIMVGDGPWREKIKDKIEVLDLENDVVLLKSTEDIQNMYQIFDLFLFPSVYEGLGIVLVEAQASGLRCFTSNMVPKEAKVTENYQIQDITDTPEEWAKNVLKHIDDVYVRKSREEDLIKSGYDIQNETVKLEKIYEQIIMEER